MEQYFEQFRKNIVGIDQHYKTPFGNVKMVYADWVASGRLYKPIEKIITDKIGPFIGNTHTQTSETGTLMTNAYHLSHDIIKKHVNAGNEDVIITYGFGMTAVVNKLQRILGLKFCGKISQRSCLDTNERPVVFITHMEHHSNHTSWFETMADVVLIEPDENLLVDLNDLREKLKKYKDRKFKIGSFTACSNVTGVITPYHEMAKIMHEFGGVCFVDFAASAPYMPINMHPKNSEEKLDAIFFSPHKFLGGPGSSGVLVFDSSLYNNTIPDNPGGGTVDWTNPWGEYKYIDNIEVREDGGSPGFLQAMRTALSIKLKEKMGIENIRKREKQLLKIVFTELPKVPNIHILADNVKDRLGVISFFIEDLHYNLIVKLLSDKFGIQARGGCACAGTYGHYLLNVSHSQSKKITDKISMGDLSGKPGWVRISLHPIMTDEELYFIINSLKLISKNHTKLSNGYIYNCKTNEFEHNSHPKYDEKRIKKWFTIS